MKNLLQKSAKDWIKDILIVIIGNFIIAVAAVYLILPMNIVTSGVAGVVVILHHFWEINETLMIILLDIGLFLIGAVFLGTKFAAATILSTIVYPVWIAVLSQFPYTLHIDPILASFYAGILIGAGTGLVFRTGGSTGGVDIPALLINKFARIELATCSLIVGIVVISCGVLAYGVEAALIGMISIFSESVMIDKMLVAGGETTKMVYIISEKWEEISRVIQEEVHRGVTLLNAEGGHSHITRPVVLCAIRQRQYGMLSKLVRKIDPVAFVVVSAATEVTGEGFTFTKGTR